MNVRLHDRRIRADRTGIDATFLDETASQKLVDPFPGLWVDCLETSTQERVIHRGLLTRTDEVLEEFTVRDADDRFAVRKPFDCLHHESSQDRLRRKIRIPALVATLGSAEK
jgi:hypothetical protein